MVPEQRRRIGDLDARNGSHRRRQRRHFRAAHLARLQVGSALTLPALGEIDQFVGSQMHWVPSRFFRLLSA